ncbi:hypothetical protein SDC9_172665 [bioreactor metagenome]|uniref:Uncharacterized protein n=1 Tax=bioreactor metagenome TaxID=1076179 RepID=A0A645GED2_9ZZZZ
MNHLGAALALGLGLPRDGPDHGFGQIDLLDLHVRNLDAPGVGLRIQRLLDVQVQRFTLCQHLVELMLAQYGAQHGLRELTGGLQIIDHLDHRLLRIHHAQIDHGIDLDRDVVARDHILRRDLQDHGAQIHPDHLLNGGNDEDQSRPLDLPEAPQREDHAALILAKNPDRRRPQANHQHQQD